MTKYLEIINLADVVPRAPFLRWKPAPQNDGPVGMCPDCRGFLFATHFPLLDKGLGYGDTLPRAVVEAAAKACGLKPS